MTLEQAIVRAKSIFPVPAGMDEFSSGIQDYSGKQVWSFRWTNSKGEIWVTRAQMASALVRWLQMER